MKVKIGVMGCASIAKRLMIPAIQNLHEHFELLAIASRSEEKAFAFAESFGIEPIVGYENLLNIKEIDAIYLPLPTGIHFEWISKCLTAGKHVLVEKSFALDYSDAKSLVAEARDKDLVVMENFMFMHHSQHNFTWQKLKNNLLGEVRLIRSQFGFPPLAKNNFRYDKDAGGGSLLDAGAYTVKLSQWLLGPNLEVASAVLYINKKMGIDLYGNATLRNDAGIVAQISFGFDNAYQCNYEIWGSKGYLVAERAFTPKPFEEPVITITVGGEKDIVKLPRDNHFENVLQRFREMIETKDIDSYYSELLDQSRLMDDISSKANIVYI